MKDGEHIQKLFNDMKQVTTYKDGKKNGKETYWYPIGQKASECFYVNDKLEGELTAWTEFGLVIQQDNYKSDLLHGLSRVWNEEGQLESEIMFQETFPNYPFISAKYLGNQSNETQSGFDAASNLKYIDLHNRQLRARFFDATKNTRIC